MPILNSINQMQEEMKEWRRDLHRIPEIGLQEHKTSEFIQNKLKSWNIDFKTGYANTGIVAWIKGNRGNGEKTIGLRADFDALPMTEKNSFDHKSMNEGMMHACGHDGHTTMLLGAAKYIKENPEFDGTVYFIFQPGEEGFGGGEKMIQDGLFNDHKIDEVYALHNWPELPLGHFGISTGAMMAAVDEYDIIVKGKGGHAALPHLAIDPIVIASQIVLSLQTIISRFLNPVDNALITVTKIHGGSAYNVIDDEVILNGTVRTFKQEIRDKIEKRINETAKGIAKANGGEVEVVYFRKYPPTINSKKESVFSSIVAKELVGEKNVQMDVEPSMGGEDFSYLLNEKPGSYLYIGQRDSNHKDYLHTTKYDFNDDLLPIGVNFWVNLVKNFFKK
ncbi:MAG: amidohydrolase [Pelagibacteraceae bacterium]|jgi:hippurate hydrolase|nr:amidohydrolase [Pelagibacteraceae bacterium]HJO13864.1 M20 aminoacylase family protein [Alphaproteobacteria bacterium]MBO6466995.1 amidohydrolase [Pelagibacteraceae bacterium]MBO6467630.1 amidohydrolase [Pelagibacteraceae bacterium]MBO6470449.1 amidohydrolase [Pelagibacteraceae bacterium]